MGFKIKVKLSQSNESNEGNVLKVEWFTCRESEYFHLLRVSRRELCWGFGATFENYRLGPNVGWRDSYVIQIPGKIIEWDKNLRWLRFAPFSSQSQLPVVSVAWGNFPGLLFLLSLSPFSFPSFHYLFFLISGSVWSSELKSKWKSRSRLLSYLWTISRTIKRTTTPGGTIMEEPRPGIVESTGGHITTDTTVIPVNKDTIIITTTTIMATITHIITIMAITMANSTIMVMAGVVNEPMETSKKYRATRRI